MFIQNPGDLGGGDFLVRVFFFFVIQSTMPNVIKHIKKKFCPYNGGM